MQSLRRIGLTYYARFIIPKARWEDCGCREVVRTLQTRDRQEAYKRRPAALECIRLALNTNLVSRHLRPLDDGWTPSWQSQALRLREQVLSASVEPAIDEASGQPGPEGSPRDQLMDRALIGAQDLEEQLRPRLGPRVAGKTAGQFYDIATARVLPLRLMADRWLRDVSPGITHQTAQQHDKALRYLAEFLVRADRDADAVAVLSSVGAEQITTRIAGEFMEWLEQSRHLGPKTAARIHSSLSSLWKWAVPRGLCTSTPWTGLTKGLKQKAERLTRVNGRKRAYHDTELLLLLRAEPSNNRRWSYSAAIFDALRLSLLTGARANEVCSLRRCDITREGAGMLVSEAAKTSNSVREIPLHPLAQRVLQDRIAALPPSADPKAPLFPELPPGGLDGKRGHRLAMVFSQFRVAVLGPSAEVDFHSLRRTFATFWEHAQAAGESGCTDITRKDILGHARGDVTGASYVARNLGWERYVSAVDGVVRSGMPAAVRLALEETAGNRPPLPSKIFRPQSPSESR